VTEVEFRKRFVTLLEANRETSLWYLRADYVFASDDEYRRILGAIQRRCDLAAFKEAGELLTWLSRRSSETSAGSSPSTAR
jgi:hypothetical protein